MARRSQRAPTTIPKSPPPAASSMTRPGLGVPGAVTSPSTGSATPHRQSTGPAPRLNFPFSPEFPHLLGANCSFRRETLIDARRLRRGIRIFPRRDRSARPRQRCRRPDRAIAPRRRPPQIRRRARCAANARVVRHWRLAHQEPRLFRLAQRRATSYARWEILRAAIDDAEQWRARRRAPRSPPASSRRADLERFRREADRGRRGRARRRARAAAQADAPRPAPRRRRSVAVPGSAPPGGRLCLALVTQDYPPGQNGGIARNVAELAHAWARARPSRACVHPRRAARRASISRTASGCIAPRIAARRRRRPTRRRRMTYRARSGTIRARCSSEVAKLDARAARRSRLRAAVGLRAGRVPARAALSAGLRVADDDGFLARFAARAAPRRPRMDARARRAAARARTLDPRARAAAARQQPRHRRGHRARATA